MIRRHGPAVTSSSGSRRQDRGTMAGRERANPKRGHYLRRGGGSGDADEPSAEWTDEGGWGTSLVAAITVSGRHALLVGYQPDEALRPSLPASSSVTLSSLGLSLPLPRCSSTALLSLTLFRNLLVSAALQAVPRAKGTGSLSTELYTCTRASLRSPES